MKGIAALALFFTIVLIPATGHADSIRFTARDVASVDWTGVTEQGFVRADAFRMSFHGGSRAMHNVPVMIGVPTTEAVPTLINDEYAWHNAAVETADDLDIFVLFRRPMNETNRKYEEFVSSISVGNYLAAFPCHHQNAIPCGNPGKKKGIPFTGTESVTPGTPDPVAVPEPSSLILFGLSFGALGLARRRNDAESTAT